MQTFKLAEEQEFIQLIQLLKAAKIVFSGGDAQQLVISGSVKVNGVVDLRKRAKIRRGTVVETMGIVLRVE
ncbi:MAG: RNA-binding S4 domain-containing protein [Bacteroidales bacterium]